MVLAGFDPSIVSQIGSFMVCLLAKLANHVERPRRITSSADKYLTLKMTSVQVLETSVKNNIQN